jgi:transposase
VSSNQPTSKRKTTRSYPPEFKARAVRLVQESVAESGTRYGTVGRVARELGILDESLRQWVRQAEIESGQRPGPTKSERSRLRQLEQENRELRRANEILRTAMGFFGRELDPPSPK